ncbi:MAG: chorismate mutase [Clostridia bacterium]|nr:chorismate mutase [Clostridia bacterium]
MNIDQLRRNIDSIDTELVELFKRRMKTAADIAEYKQQNNLPVLDKSRERELLNKVADISGEEYENYTLRLYSQILELSKAYQSKIIKTPSPLYEKISEAVANKDRVQFPEKAIVACQGVEGAYSSLACEKLFRTPSIMFVNSFDAVFSAVSQGLCQYGVLPIENSTAGSVNRVYDLMDKQKFSIVKCVRLKINHSLLTKKGTRLEDIKEIYSHEMAIAQSADFLSTLDGVKIIPCDNTAVAAKMVADSERNDVAAISSAECAALYGLETLCEAVQDKADNYTRFICISKKLEIYPGADKTSLVLTLPHKPGALYNLLSMFSALDINILKLESRPLDGRDFEFMFYFDVEASVYSDKFLQMITELPEATESFSYLGSYSETV